MIYHYDLDGKLIAESTSAGTFTKEYLYMGKVRVAMVDVAGGGTVYAYQNDRLGTPELLTTRIDNNETVVWEAWYEPFGEAHVHPSSSAVNNMRLPGQYFDQETGFHYNYHRYYDPRTGRYLTPDPIGLEGGSNLFAYVENNPTNSTDPYGLEPPRDIPPNVNIRSNIEEAKRMSTIEFYNAVRSGGNWDYKQHGSQYQDFGNYNYGLTGRASGFSESVLKRAAGAYQKYTGTSRPEWGSPWGRPPYGDDPRDQHWISEGIKDHDTGYYDNGGKSCE